MKTYSPTASIVRRSDGVVYAGTEKEGVVIDAGDLSFRELGASSIRLAKLAGLDIRVRLSSVVMISSTTKDRGAVIVAERNSVTSRDGHRKIARLIAAEERRAQWKELKP